MAEAIFPPARIFQLRRDRAGLAALFSQGTRQSLVLPVFCFKAPGGPALFCLLGSVSESSYSAFSAEVTRDNIAVIA